jgi:hypothetical protein
MESAMKGRTRVEAERRRFPRALAPRGGPAVVRLRPGREASVIDLSSGGALVEGMTPLRPGSPVELRVTLPGWEWQGRAQVIRCHVSALPRDQKIRYRAGLQFEAPLAATVDDGHVTQEAGVAGSRYPRG